MKKLCKYRHLIWDWNGTIIDDVNICVTILNGILRHYEKPQITLQQYRSEFDFPVIDYYRRLGFDFSKISFDDISRQYIAEYNNRQYECPLQDGAERVLSSCKAGGLKQSILSAYNQKMLKEVVEYFGLDGFFDNLVGLSDFYAASKLENGKKLMKKLGLVGSDVLLIGDTMHDYEVAEQIGVDCVLIDDGHQIREKLESTNAIVINSINEVLTLLK